MEGTFLWGLVATDVCSGWTELLPLLAREQSLVAEALDVIWQRIQIPVRGLDTGNDGAFIIETLRDYCERHRIEFTRSRPYHKNDQAWIEQKNGAVVRRFVGSTILTSSAPCTRPSGAASKRCEASSAKATSAFGTRPWRGPWSIIGHDARMCSIGLMSWPSGVRETSVRSTSSMPARRP
jgi:hypothetical protein